MLNIVLFGPPGAGKGTQAAKIKEKYNLIHIATGDLLRQRIAQGTELGLKAKQYIDKGELVPDEVVIGMIENVIKQNLDSNGIIFDGFPRTVNQAQALDNLLDKFNAPLKRMIYIDVERNELIKRLLERGKISGRSDDQSQEVIENRLAVYNSKTAPVKEFYEQKGICTHVNGMGTIEEIFVRLCNVIDSI